MRTEIRIALSNAEIHDHIAMLCIRNSRGEKSSTFYSSTDHRVLTCADGLCILIAEIYTETLVNWLHHLCRLPYFHSIWSRIPLGSVRTRVDHGIFKYPNYAYGVYWSAYLAKQLRLPGITVVEFGVAGGRGLLALEEASIQIEQALGVQIDVVGFDTGAGMPEPVDYRDLPHIWDRGFYKMDFEKLRGQLTKAQLILGDVRETVAQFLASGKLLPLGFIAFDLDYYSSTVAAFEIFSGNATIRLPRIHCYFDDLASHDLGCLNEHVGELLAIREFNSTQASQKIAKIEQLRLNRPRWEHWQERMYVFHDFAHPKYTQLVISDDDPHSQLAI